MRSVRDDLPNIKASYLRANGLIAAESTWAAIELEGRRFDVRLALRRFPGGGNWSLFRTPCCGRIAQRLWLHEDRLVCRRCCDRMSLPARCETMSVPDSTAVRIPQLLAKLHSDQPLHSTARPGRRMERRAALELSLREALLSVRRHNLRDVHKLGSK
jgi:hypothetical protein